MRVLLLVTALLTALVTPAHGAPGELHVVEVRGSKFTPERLEIKRFDRVKWVFKGPGEQSVRQGIDTVMRPCKPAGGPNSGPKKPGQSYTYRYEMAGNYVVFDALNEGCRKGLLNRIGVNDEG